MNTTLTPYLNFPGNAAEAMRFYQGIFGGELDILTFGDFHVADMPAQGTMHSHLHNELFAFSAADAQPGSEAEWGTSRVSLAIMGDDFETISGWFNALAVGGTVGQPLSSQVWGDVYGQVTDKYGIAWMFNISAQS